MEVAKAVSNKVYTLQKVSTENDTWKTFDTEVEKEMTLQFGSTMGMLGQDFECTCGCRMSIEYFFCTTDKDHIFYCMKGLLRSEGLQINLPYGDKGLFILTKSSPDFNDDYIKDVLVQANKNDDDTNHTVDLMFETFQNRIRLRTMFKKLYYRSFRLAFAPGKRGEMRNRMELLNHPCCKA